MQSFQQRDILHGNTIFNRIYSNTTANTVQIIIIIIAALGKLTTSVLVVFPIYDVCARAGYSIVSRGFNEGVSINFINLHLVYIPPP